MRRLTEVWWGSDLSEAHKLFSLSNTIREFEHAICSDFRICFWDKVYLIEMFSYSAIDELAR